MSAHTCINACPSTGEYLRCTACQEQFEAACKTERDQLATKDARIAELEAELAEEFAGRVAAEKQADAFEKALAGAGASREAGPYVHEDDCPAANPPGTAACVQCEWEEYEKTKAKLAALDPKDDEEHPDAFYRPFFKAADAMLERAHTKVQEITGYSGGAGNWPAQEDAMRLGYALQHLRNGDCSKNEDAIRDCLRAELAAEREYRATDRKARDAWHEKAESLEKERDDLAQLAQALVDDCPQWLFDGASCNALAAKLAEIAGENT